MSTIEIKEPEYICPVCAERFGRFKALHGHMMMTHREEYARRGYTLAAYGIAKDPFENIYREVQKAAEAAETAGAPERETR